ncbi:MAG TPA: alpha/beta fold hydrolase [Actinopolymorphaceae bacterium]|nr:alpha/beta fold hydrolase [Actinopolymorphaceae bacterium]
MTLTYERRGSGPPLVLLHGLGHRWQGWSPVLPLLAAEHEVIAVDLPGFGASPPTAGTRWREDLVPAVAGFLAELDLDRPHVAGNSLGGVIALELAIAGSVSSATALAPAGFWLPRERRWARGLMGVLRAATFLPAPLLRSMAGSARMRNLSYGALVGRPANLAPAAILQDAMALRASPAYTAVARNGRGYAVRGVPRCPVTIAWGTRDRILPYRQALRAREQLPGARHVDLPGCGHVPMSDDPELVASVILQTTKGTASS